MRPSCPFVRLTTVLLGTLYVTGIVRAAKVRSPALSDNGPFAASTAAAQPPAEGLIALEAHLAGLFESWKAIPPAEMAAKAPLVNDRIDAALTNYVISQIDQRPPALALNIQHDLDRALKASVWKAIFGLSKAEIEVSMESNSSGPWVLVLRGSGIASDLYVEIFAIGYGNVFSTRVHGLAPATGKYHSVASEHGQLDGMVSGAERLRSFAPHELRFITWCLHIGSPEGLVSVALYKFDGRTLKVAWERENLPGARITLAGDRVTIESAHIISHQQMIWAHDRHVYRQVPNGLSLIATRHWTDR